MFVHMLDWSSWQQEKLFVNQSAQKVITKKCIYVTKTKFRYVKTVNAKVRTEKITKIYLSYCVIR